MRARLPPFPCDYGSSDRRRRGAVVAKNAPDELDIQQPPYPGHPRHGEEAHHEIDRFSSAPAMFGGEGEIRTRDPRKGMPVFKTGAFNRSATSPFLDNQSVAAIIAEFDAETR
jgi:hypothetical protein